jgi:ElaB/YqjD/DUF883 family membrane-anchored ribosome-binding protein
LKAAGFLGDRRMADNSDVSSRKIRQGEPIQRSGSTPKAPEARVQSLVADFVDAARSGTESLLEEQKHQMAERVSGIAAALRGAAESLDQSQNRAIARYADQAAERIESFTGAVREQRWHEIVAKTEDFARRQPTIFVLAAIATGFVVGRFLLVSTAGDRHDGEATQGASRVAARSVTAAVSSASGSGTGVAEGYGAGASGTMEDR